LCLPVSGLKYVRILPLFPKIPYSSVLQLNRSTSPPVLIHSNVLGSLGPETVSHLFIFPRIRCSDALSQDYVLVEVIKQFSRIKPFCVQHGGIR